MDENNENNINMSNEHISGGEPKNGSSYFLIVAIVVILVIAGGFYLMQGENQNNTENLESESNLASNELPADIDTGISSEEVTEGNAKIPISVEIDYTNNGFTPKETTVNIGTTVRFTNSSDKSMWVASAIHPDHDTYSGTSLDEHCDDTEDVSFDQCKGGDEYSFTFDKAGTWGYHNHFLSNDFGKIIVK